MFEIDGSGTIKVQAFDLPLSAALSNESKALLAMMLPNAGRFNIPHAHDFATEEEFKTAVDAFRAVLDEGMARAQSQAMLENFPVEIRPGKLGGVAIEEFVPRDTCDEDRVLINLHGGGFFSGATYIARIESIPLAHKAKCRVISVDYRQGYEHKYPAASEDVFAVYAALLKNYAPSQIGVYGGSAGGMLTAQATAWILDKGLPPPGAIGIFGAGTGGMGDGDYFSAIGTGKTPPDSAMGRLAQAKVGYFSHVRADDYLLNPIIAPKSFRAKFPPTLLITGTRAFDLSPALATHRALAQAGVDASLHVFDGQGHCFYYIATTPEAIDAYDTIVAFFRRHLSR